MSRTWKLFALAILLHSVAFGAIALFMPIRYETLSTINIYLNDGLRLHAGLVPYRDFQFEYPPLAAPLLWLPVLFGRDIPTYRVIFAVMMLVFDLLGVSVGLWAMQHFTPAVPPWGLLLIGPLLLLAAGRMIVFERFDLAVAVLMLVAIVLVASGHARLGWTILGLATAVKLYPVLAAPLFLIFAPRWTKREVFINAGLFALAVLVPTLIVTQGELTSLSQFVAYHANRGLEIGSSYTSLVLGAKLLGLTGSAYIGQEFAFGASQLVAPQAALLSKLSVPLTGLALLGLYVLAWRVRRNEGQGSNHFSELVDFSLLVTLAFMLFGKVLSPQYLLWLVPLALVLTRQRGEVWLWLGAALVLTQWYYPNHWNELMDFTPLAITVLVLRNAILFGLGVIVLLPYLAENFKLGAFPTPRSAGQTALRDLPPQSH